MAKKQNKKEQQYSDSNKEVEEVKVAETVKPIVKKKLPTKDYTLKVKVKVSGVLKKKGEKISLTEQGYRFFRSKNYV
ncbi:MAG: hypothetical protein KDC81_14780 [Flavobacteriaceae bacterium]|nr:hypothetical protein [Flavobacteriaceae bacterium]